jgi:hypothetical protein
MLTTAQPSKPTGNVDQAIERFPKVLEAAFEVQIRHDRPGWNHRWRPAEGSVTFMLGNP